VGDTCQILTSALGTRANRSGRQDIFRPIDSEVYDEQNQNVALSKSDFAAHVSAAVEKFGEVNFDQFRHIETVINRIIRQATALIDLPSCGLASFLATLEGLEPRRKLIAVLEAAIRASKLAAITSTKSSTVGKHWGVLRSQSA